MVAANPSSLLVNTKEASKLLSVSRQTLLEMVRAGSLPAVRIGRRAVRFSVRDLETWVAANSTARRRRKPAPAKETAA